MKNIVAFLYLFSFLFSVEVSAQTPSRANPSWQRGLKGGAAKLCKSYSQSAFNIRYTYFFDDYVIRNGGTRIAMEIAWEDSRTNERYWVAGYMSFNHDNCQASWRTKEYSEDVDPSRLRSKLGCIGSFDPIARSMGVGRPFRRRR